MSFSKNVLDFKKGWLMNILRKVIYTMIIKFLAMSFLEIFPWAESLNNLVENEKSLNIGVNDFHSSQLMVLSVSYPNKHALYNGYEYFFESAVLSFLKRKHTQKSFPSQKSFRDYYSVPLTAFENSNGKSHGADVLRHKVLGLLVPLQREIQAAHSCSLLSAFVFRACSFCLPCWLSCRVVLPESRLIV